MPASWLYTGALGAWPCPQGRFFFSQVKGHTRAQGPRHALPPGMPSTPASGQGDACIHAQRDTRAERGLPGSVPQLPGLCPATGSPSQAPEVVLPAASETHWASHSCFAGSEEPDTGEAEHRQLPAGHHRPHKAAGPQVPAGLQRAERHRECARQPPLCTWLAWCRELGGSSPSLQNRSCLRGQVQAGRAGQRVVTAWVPPALPSAPSSQWWLFSADPCSGVEGGALPPLQSGPVADGSVRVTVCKTPTHSFICSFIHSLIHSPITSRV